ncbi:MAG: thioesterase family protein [Pseudomonadota bacterium]|nr:thioesterase family protein [Pseudomonadota bacterium]MED5227585.1 thioesterase family protein [Pseudomonadota bacterium]
MKDFLETYRGDVSPWEVDSTEHFTVAYYYEKFEAATFRFLRHLKLDPYLAKTTAALTHYKTELHNRDIYYIKSALISAGENPVIGHKLYKADSDILCTTMQQTLSNISVEAQTIEWDGDSKEERRLPGNETSWVHSLKDVVQPNELNWSGNLSLPAYIHRFSTANSFIMAAFGLTPEYLTKSRVGLSTFEFQLQFYKLVNSSDLINIESCIAQLGSSSVRFYHRMVDAETGEKIAGLSQYGVHLDLDSRRPSPIPDELRKRAEHLLPKL